MLKPFAALLVLALTIAGVGCSCNPACQFRGTINEPGNLTMRKSMLRKAMGDICKQMTSRSAPLKLTADAPVIGRFYPTQCTANEGETLNVTFAGFGYAWTNVTKKMTFTAQGSVGYRYDFRVTDGDACDIYAYFRPARIDGSDFKVHRVEGTVASLLTAVSPFGDTFGRQLLAQKLREGFTVIARDGNEANVELALGIVPLGQKPFHPYQLDRGDGRVLVENERVELHQNQRDYIGPITVEGEGKAIFVKAMMDGAPAIDLLVLRKFETDPALQATFDVPQAVPLAAAPLRAEVLQAGVELQRAIPVPPGMYYVVLDNTPTAGQVSPPVHLLDDRAAVVSYLIQIGDAS